MNTDDNQFLNRRTAVAELLHQRNDLLVVAGLGSAVWDVEAAGEDDLNFYILGAMGSVVPIALGLALAQPSRPVLALTGDAELLMSAGSIATASIRRSPNLSIAVLDNGRFGETGSQISHTGQGVDLSSMARAAGFPVAESITDPEQLPKVREAIHRCEGPAFYSLTISADMPAVVMPVRDGALLKHRFRQRLLGSESAKV